MKNGYLKAVEVLGEMILEMQEELKFKDFELETLKKKIREMEVLENENDFRNTI